MSRICIASFVIILLLLVLPFELQAQVRFDSLDYHELKQLLTEESEVEDQALRLGLEHALALRCISELEDTDCAISYLRSVIAGWELIRDTTSANIAREDLARLYMANRYYQEAIYQFDLLSGNAGMRNDANTAAIMQNAIGDTYLAMDSIRMAIPYYKKVEALQDSIPGKLPAVISEMLKVSVTALTRSGIAVAGLTDTTTVDFGRLIDSPSDLHSVGLLNSGHRYYHLGNPDMARSYYLRCLAEENADGILHRDALHRLAAMHRDQDDWEVAYHYLARYSVLNDSMIQDRRQRVIDRLLVTYQTYEQKSKIRELEKDQKIAAFQNRLQKVVTFSLLFGSVIILIGAYFTIRNYQHRFNANQIIHEQKTEINRQRINELENNLKIESMHAMLMGQEAERERIAKDLHDSLGGLLSTVKLHFDAVKSNDRRISDMPEYQHAYSLLDTACKEVRNISNNMQPGALQELGLIPALKDLVGRVQTPDAPAVTFSHEGLNGRLDTSIGLNVYRIIQELLNNALRHSRATEISIHVAQNNGALNLTVQDNGCGYEPGNVTEGMGTQNIASRVNYLKGDLSIHSVLGEGTTTQIAIPVS